MTISVGICTYKRPALLKRVLDSLLSQTRIPDEIIVFDSSENDETKKTVISISSPTIRYHHTETRTILPKGRNEIIKKCSSDILTFLDDDAIPKNRFIETVLSSFGSFGDVGGVTGPTINSDENLNPIVPLIYDNKKRTSVYPWGEVRSDTRRWIPTLPQKCKVMIGANMSYRTKLLKDIGGFDEQFENPSYREESDVQTRIAKLGYSFLYHPDAYVFHLVKQPGGIEDIESKQANYFYLAGKNHRYFCDKHFPKWKTRLAWIFFNRTPPCFWLALILAIIRNKSYLMWHKGLWENPKK